MPAFVHNSESPMHRLDDEVLAGNLAPMPCSTLCQAGPHLPELGARGRGAAVQVEHDVAAWRVICRIPDVHSRAVYRISSPLNSMGRSGSARGTAVLGAVSITHHTNHSRRTLQALHSHVCSRMTHRSDYMMPMHICQGDGRAISKQGL